MNGANVAIIALAVAAILAFMVASLNRELGICIQLLDPNVRAVPL